MALPMDNRLDALRRLQSSLNARQAANASAITPLRRTSSSSREVAEASRELRKAGLSARSRILSDPLARRGDPREMIAEIGRIQKEGTTDSDGGLFGILGDVAGKVGSGAAYLLNRPLAVVASAGKEISDIASGQASFEDFLSQSLAKDTTLSKYLPKSGNKWIDGAIGLVADIVADPLTWVTFGASAAGRANRLALATKAAEAANIAKMPSLAAKVADGRIAALGEWALTKAEREVLNVPQTLSWSMGPRMGKAIGKQGKLSGTISSGAALAGKPFTVARARVGQSKVVRPLQELTTPKSVKAAGLTFYGRGQETGQVIDRLRDLASYSASIRGNAVRQTVARELGSRASELSKQVTDFEASSGFKIHEVLEKQRVASSPLEQQLADNLRKFFDDARRQANETVGKFSGKRNVNAYDIGHRENYVPHTLTKEAREFIGAGRWGGAASQIRTMLGLSKKEFLQGPPPLNARKLETGTNWLGKPLQSNTGDNAASIMEINARSQEVLGFKWFEDDGGAYLKNYVDSIANVSSRVAFADRLFDYGSDVVQGLTKIVPDKNVVNAWRNAAKLVDNMAAPVLAELKGNLDEAAGILGPRVKLAEALLATEPGGKLLTPKQLSSVRRTLSAAMRSVREADGVMATAPSAIREEYETVMSPLRSRIAAINTALVNGDEEELIAITALQDLYQRLFPEANGIPSDPRVLAEDIIDAAKFAKDTPRGIELGIDDVDELESVVTGAVQGIERGRSALEIPLGRDTAGQDMGSVVASRGEAETALSRLQSRLETPEIVTNIVPGASRELAQQTKAVGAREVVETVPQMIDDVAAARAAGLADVASRQAEAEDIISRQREMFGGDTGISGRAVPLPAARQGAQAWVERRGGTYTPPPPTQMVNPVRQSQVARAYKKLPEGRPPMDTPAGRAAHASYQALIRDIDEQYDYLTKELGIKVEFVEGDPYPNPAEMFIDIQNNGRLKIWSGESDNPMLTTEQNLKFRAVHDYFGHASMGTRFDRNGEEGAFLHHIQMFSPEARGAAASELRGQNAYLIEFGEFGPQKGYLLPKKYWGPDPSVGNALEGLVNYGGFTVDLAGREARPTSGYQVAMGGPLEVSIKAGEIQTWTDVVDKLYAPFFSRPEVAKALNRKGQFFGTYYSNDSDKLYAEVSRNYDSFDEAYRQAVATRQESILDWKAFDEDGESEIFLLDIMDDMIKRGEKLSDEELQTKAYLEKQRASKKSQKRIDEGGIPGLIERGVGRYRQVVRGEAPPVRSEPKATTQGLSGVERLRELPPTAQTEQQVAETLNSQTARLKELGYIDTGAKRTRQGTRMNPLEAEARGIKATSTRKTNELTAQLEEATAILDVVKPLDVARQEWDAGVGRIYKEDIGRVLDVAQSRPPKGAAGTATAQWVSNMAEILSSVNSPGLALSPIERDVMTRVLESMKGMEAQLALWESTQDFTAQQLAKATSGEIGGRIVKNTIKGWEKIESLGIQMPPELRDRMFGRMEELATPAGQKGFMDLYRRYNRFFKVTAMLSPGFIVRNSYTAAFNNFVQGVGLKDTGDALAFAAKMWKNGLDSALQSVPKRERELYRRAVEATFASGAGQTTDDIVAPALGAGAKWLNRRPVSSWSKMNETAEVAFRLGSALSSLRKGLDFDRAVANITRYHFDYSDLSKLDEVARQFIPFWIFASRNIPLQMTNMIARPSMYLAYEKAQENFPTEEGMIMPQWLARRNPIGLGGGAVLNLDLPQVDMAEQVSMFTDPARLLSQFNPLLKLPMELSGGRQYATNVPFKTGPQPVGGPLDFPAFLAGLVRGGSGRTADGKFYTSDKAQYAMTNLLPTLGQLQRLLPTIPFTDIKLGGKEAYQDRATSSRAGFFGLPYRQVTPQEKSNELTRRQFLIQEYLSNLTRTGYLTPKERG